LNGYLSRIRRDSCQIPRQGYALSKTHSHRWIHGSIAPVNLPASDGGKDRCPGRLSRPISGNTGTADRRTRGSVRVRVLLGVALKVNSLLGALALILLTSLQLVDLLLRPLPSPTPSCRRISSGSPAVRPTCRSPTTRTSPDILRLPLHFLGVRYAGPLRSVAVKRLPDMAFRSRLANGRFGSRQILLGFSSVRPVAFFGCSFPQPPPVMGLVPEQTGSSAKVGRDFVHQINQSRISPPPQLLGDIGSCKTEQKVL
jgi:hypothetical protein